jgi:GTP-binding protein
MAASSSSRKANAAAPSAKLPLVAIVGRPNVGKSTLFNRLIGARKAIVDDLPGVTRDRNYAEALWAGRRYRIVDTGGLDANSGRALDESVQSQSRCALDEADAIVFLFDGKGGLNPLDREAVDLLRRSGKPVFFAVNKLDSQQRADNLYEFYALGIEPLYSISAEHGLGIPDLMDDLISRFPPDPIADEDESGAEEAPPQRVAIVGRPNVGKSTLTNRLLGYERSVVDAAPGTTRDSLDSPFQLMGESCILIDTAGIRRKARIDDRIERFSVSRSLQAVDRADLIIHVIDGPESATDQDAQVLSYACQRGKAVVLAVNKWDLVSQSGGTVEKYRAEVNYRLAFLEFVPIVFIAAATGYGLRGLSETAARVLKAYRRKVSTSAVNQALQKIVRAHSAPLARGKPVKFFYATQSGTRPPTFTVFVNTPGGVLDSYKKYLIHQLQQHLGFEQTPIRLDLRARREPKPRKRA